MVVLLVGYGNHSNRLIQSIHFEAFCLENHLAFKNFVLSDMHGLFGATERCNSTVSYYFYKVLKKAHIFQTCMADEPGQFETYKANILKHKNIIVGGWKFRVSALTTRYHHYFIERYTLKENIWRSHPAVVDFLALRAACPEKTMVAVHIRRKDYREYQNGKYFFDDETYLDYMDQMETMVTMQSGLKPYFLVFSDEKIELSRKENYLIHQNAWYIDQYLMSQCDYIIGPPSTFSEWASYIGKTRYYHFRSQAEIIDWKNFRICMW